MTAHMRRLYYNYDMSYWHKITWDASIRLAEVRLVI